MCVLSIFWWGGDLYIINDVGESLVFLGGDKNAEEENRRGDADSFPTSMLTQKLAALTIEAKKETVYLPSKKYQLWANMTVVFVEKFAFCCAQHYSKQNLKDIQVLTGYGALLCGDGSLSAYKLFTMKN